MAALNASYFDPDAYLKRVLKETRLAELAALQRDMLGEVGGLDSDMQVGRLPAALGHERAGWRLLKAGWRLCVCKISLIDNCNCVQNATM